MKYLITENGIKLSSRKEILEFLKQKQLILKSIRRTPEFSRDFQNGDLSEYNQIENSFKLKTQDNILLNDNEQILAWVEKNKVR